MAPRQPRRPGGIAPMSSNRAWMPLYPGDYLNDTMHLSLQESGAYLHLLMAHWALGALPDDDQKLARIVKLRVDHWRKIAPVIRAFFVPGEVVGTLVQKRLMAEMAKAADVSAKRSKAAKARVHTQNTEATPPGVATNDSDVKPLQNNNTADANAGVLHGFCTTQPQPQDSVPLQGTAPMAPSRPRSQAPMLYPIQGGGGAVPEVDGVVETNPAEAARRQLWSEGRRILAVLKPGIAHDAMGKVLGKWARDAGGDHAFVVQRLRDAESDLANSRILGDPMAWVSKLMQRGPGGSSQRGAQPMTPMQLVRELTAKIEREACAQ